MFGIIRKRLLYYYLTYYLVNINAFDHKKCVSLIIKNARFNVLLLICILINKIKTSTTIHLQINLIKLLAVVIL